MKSLTEIKYTLARSKNKLLKKYNLKEIYIFGSYSTGEANEFSDIDIMVELKKPIGLKFVDLADELEKLLGIKVDLVSRGAINERLFNEISGELQIV